jgi:hypothetical protein
MKRDIQRGIEDYFSGWERYAVKEDDGQWSTIMPGELNTYMLILKGEQIYYGPYEEERGYYALQTGLKKEDLSQHQDSAGQWKPGRLVIEDHPGNYQVWVRYDKQIAVDNKHQPWAVVPDNGRVLHFDENDEKAPKIHKMDAVLEKMGKYFGEYEIGVYDEGKGKEEGKVWIVQSKDAGYLKAMNAQGRHIFIRPSFENEPYYMMHDDVKKDGLAKYHKDADGRWRPGRLVVESSPGNYQVWVKSERPLSVEEKKHWLAQMKSDPGASPLHRWGRAPGFRNRKEKYRNEKGYPLARLEWVDWRGEAHIPVVQIAKPEQRHTGPPGIKRESLAGELPTRDRYFKGLNSEGKPRESEQDLAYMLALLRRGADPETDNHSGEKRTEQYLNRTLEKAQSVINDSPYKIDIYADAQKKTKLNSFSVAQVPPGRDHKEYLEQRAKDLVVKEGLQPGKGILVDIRPIEKAIGQEKALGGDGGMGKSMGSQ